MTIDELWYWHAYDYGWRRVRLNVPHDASSPIDPNRVYHNQTLVQAAESYWRKKLNVPLNKPRAKPAEDVVRPDWRKIPATELTAAERELAAPEFERMATAARKAIEAAESKWSRGFQPPRQRKPAPEIPPHVLPDDSDPAVQEWLSSMGSLTEAAE